MFNSKKKTEETAAEEVKKAPETAPAKEETAKADKSEANSNPAEKKEPADIPAKLFGVLILSARLTMLFASSKERSTNLFSCIGITADISIQKACGVVNDISRTRYDIRLRRMISAFGR